MLLLALKNHQIKNTQSSNLLAIVPNYKMAQKNFPDHQDTIRRHPIVRRSDDDHELLKKMTPLVVSVSILFSLLLSHFSYPSLSLYFHSFRNSKLFSYTMDKNSMFLLCNGLLVFLAKFSRFMGANNSGTSSSSSSTWSSYYYDHGDSTNDSFDHIEPRREIEARRPTPISKLEEEPIIIMEGDNHDHQVEELVAIKDIVQEKEGGGGGGEMGSGFLIIGEEGNCYNEAETDLEEVEDGGRHHQGEEELVVDDKLSILEGVEEGNALLSTEELNKKFDEFIRKMKEGIRFEADQQRLVLVK